MDTILKRTLTLKSKIGFGKYKNSTVSDMIGMKKEMGLISIYFNLGKIDFTVDVLDLIKIPLKLRIDKPGKDNDKYYQCLNELGYEREIVKRRRSIKDRESRGFNSGLALLSKTKKESKAKLMGKNHGRK